MKLTSQQIKSLAEDMVAELHKHGLAKFLLPVEEVLAIVEEAITDDLRVEDRLNREVEEILKTHEKEIEQGQMAYKTMFDLVKKKLIRERGLVL